MIKGIIFDLDGTLLDTLDDLTTAVNKFLAKHDFARHSREDVRKMVGNGAAKLVERALPKIEFTKDEMLKFYAEYAECYATSQKFTKIYDGIDEVLDYLTEKNIKIAVVSNKPDKATQFCKENYLKKWNINPCFGQIDGIPIKPAPFMLNKVIEIWEFEKSEVLFVGDSPEDMLTAKNAQIAGIGAGWGFRSCELLDKAGAEFSFEKTLQLLEFIKSL